MAGKMCNLYLDEETIKALDDMAESMNTSRSKVANAVLKTAMGVSGLSEFNKWLIDSALEKRKELVTSDVITSAG